MKAGKQMYNENDLNKSFSELFPNITRYTKALYREKPKALDYLEDLFNAPVKTVFFYTKLELEDFAEIYETMEEGLKSSFETLDNAVLNPTFREGVEEKADAILNILPPKETLNKGEMLLAKLPKDLIINTSMPIKNIFIPSEKYFNQIHDTGSAEINLSSSKNAKYLISVSAYTFNNEDIKTSHDLSLLDKMVCDTIFSFFNAGIYEMTSKQITKILKGNKEVEAKDLMIKDIEASMDRLNKTFFSIEQKTSSGQFENLKDFEDIVSGHIANFIKRTTTMNGQQVVAYYFSKDEKIQILYHYMKALKQVEKINPEYLNIQGVQSNTKNSQIIYFLYTRIAGMKRSDNKIFQKKINLDTLFTACDIDVTTSQKKTRLINTIQKILLDWKTRGTIKEYSFDKRGTRSYKNIIIEL